MDIPASMARIGERAFTGCTNLVAVNIHDLVAWCGIDYPQIQAPPLSYAHHLYLDGAEVRDLVIPARVEEIGNWAFLGGSGLTSVTIPDSV